MENRLMDTAGVEGGESGRYAESNIETYIATCKIRQPTAICCMTQGTQTGAQLTT